MDDEKRMKRKEYQHRYYLEHRDELLRSHREWNRRHYVPHPPTPVPDEEKKKRRREYRREWERRHRAELRETAAGREYLRERARKAYLNRKARSRKKTATARRSVKWTME